MNAEQGPTTRLPAWRDLTLPRALSLLIATLMASASVAGLLFGTGVYPTDDLRRSCVPTDVAILLVGLPVLLASVWLAWRGKLIGLLLWPGALFFVLYTYLVYVFVMPLNAAFLLHLALFALSAYTVTGLVASIDGEAVRKRLAGSVSERIGGGILAGLGVLFCVRAIAVLVGALVGQEPMARVDLAPNVADVVIAPALVIGGVLLWRRRPLGYVTGLGFLFQASMLFVGLVIILLVQPFVTDAPLALVDAGVVLVLGLIGIVPTALFARGVVSGRRSRPVQAPSAVDKPQKMK